MAISSDLFTAILAMDSYNRGYNAGVDIIGNQIGNAVLGDHSSILKDENGNRVDIPSSFFAQAYTINGSGVAGLNDGETVISFRGTDDLSLGADPLNGWTLGAGFPGASQAALAAQFYSSVTGLGLFDGASSNTILTGHSLGGGLAGYIAALTGSQGASQRRASSANLATCSSA